MKKFIALLLVTFMLLPFCLTACNTAGDVTDESKQTQSVDETNKPTDSTDGGNESNGDTNNENGDDNGDNQKPNDSDDPGTQPEDPGTQPEDPGTQPEDPGNEPDGPSEPEEPIVLEREVYYIPENIHNKMTALFEETTTGGTAYWMEGAPYTLRDRESFKGKTLSSISVGVYGTNTASEGNFIFTLSIFKDTPEAIANSNPLRTYKIKVSAKEFGLEENASNIYKLIKVDLTDYNITIADDEILAIADVNDTLRLAYADGSNPIYKLFEREFPQMRGFSLKVGREAWSPSSSNALICNFTFAEKYDSKQEYLENATIEEMIEAVKGVYGGANLSVFGDSITTLMGVSNSTKYNSTIGSNVAYYANPQYTGSAKNSPLEIEDTYWGRFVTLGDMNLCVNNAWGGDTLSSDRYINRAQQLHNLAGEKPDLILTYFGINDVCSASRPAVGELLTLLDNRGNKSEDDVITEWLEAILANKANYNSFDFAQMYAYMLYLMMINYPDAKIVCVSLVSNKIAERNGSDVEDYNVVIKILAEYFGALYVEQGNVITKNDRNFYMMDGDEVHPNIAGHGLIFEETIRTLYAEIIADPDYEIKKYPEVDNDESDGYTVESHYVPESTMDKFEGLFETLKANGSVYSMGSAPFALNDIESFKNKRLTSITIPVMSTGAADADGCFTFTLSIFKSDFASISNSTALRTFKIKVLGAENGLSANQSNIYKFVTVDLREYGIFIAEDELIAFGLSGDTLLPGYVVDSNCTNPLGKVMKKEFSRMTGFSAKVGRAAWDPNAGATNSLLFDFTMETTYESKAEYEATLKEETDFQTMLEAVKDAYSGKNYSVFGDSISTFVGVSNNVAYNTTIGGNAMWYSKRGTGGLYDHTYTYWGSFTRLAGMNLCVDNAWSGDTLSSKKFKTRAINLHNDTGETAVNPDLIFVYIGINDIAWGEKNPEKWKLLYDELLELMTNKYENAKIVCIGLTANHRAPNDPNINKPVPQYNEIIEEVAGKYGALYVDQASVINSSNFQSYMHDTSVLHPNAAGHELLFREIVKVLYNDLKK